MEGEKEYNIYIHHYYAARSTSLAKEILFINFEVLKRTGNIKKRGEECVSFHSIGSCMLGYYPLPKSILEDQADSRLAAGIRSESGLEPESEAPPGPRLRRLYWCPHQLLQMAH